VEYLRVPMADVGPIKVPDSVTDEQGLFLSDIFPTDYMAAVDAQIEPKRFEKKKKHICRNPDAIKSDSSVIDRDAARL
jgi:threonine dehydrogenase-like Zn-dependent dehydrogenase